MNNDDSGSCGYAARLSSSGYRGKLNLIPQPDPHFITSSKAQYLATLMLQSQTAPSIVFHTGAGISTSSGITDFRGPQGVWTEQARLKKSKLSQEPSSFSVQQQTAPQSMIYALPSVAHASISHLESKWKCLKQEKSSTSQPNVYVVSQNVDGLHLRSGISSDSLAELHGNLFGVECFRCRTRSVVDFELFQLGVHFEVEQMLIACETCGFIGRQLGSVLDWNDALPRNDLKSARKFSKSADHCIVLGSSLQMIPSRNLPELCRARGGRLTIVNLSQTPKDNVADLIIRAPCDDVMVLLLQKLDLLPIPEYDRHTQLFTQLSIEHSILQGSVVLASDQFLSCYHNPFFSSASITMIKRVKTEDHSSKSNPVESKITLLQDAKVSTDQSAWKLKFEIPELQLKEQQQQQSVSFQVTLQLHHELPSEYERCVEIQLEYSNASNTIKHEILVARRNYDRQVESIIEKYAISNQTLLSDDDSLKYNKQLFMKTSQRNVWKCVLCANTFAVQSSARKSHHLNCTEFLKYVNTSNSLQLNRHLD